MEVSTPRFPATYCSKCAREFGPGDQGYSHCEDHKGSIPAPRGNAIIPTQRKGD